jgi:hypothetical protein
VTAPLAARKAVSARLTQTSAAPDIRCRVLLSSGVAAPLVWSVAEHEDAYRLRDRRALGLATVTGERRVDELLPVGRSSGSESFVRSAVGASSSEAHMSP